MQPILSIIIPCYNVEPFLLRCLDSFDKSKIETGECQVILINDGSTDNTFNIAMQWKEQFPSTILVQQENCGSSAARNKGIDLALGKYIWFIDGDDSVPPNAITILLNQIQNFPTDIFHFGITKQLKNKKWKTLSPPTSQEIDSFKLLKKPLFRPNTFFYLYRTEWLQNSGIRFKAGQVFEDIGFTSSILLKCNNVTTLNCSLYLYHYNDSSVMNNNTVKHQKKKLLSQKMVLEHLSELLNQTTDKDKIAGIEQIILSNRSVYLTLLYQYHPTEIKKRWQNIPPFHPSIKLKGKDLAKHLTMKHYPVLYARIVGNLAPQP